MHVQKSAKIIKIMFGKFFSETDSESKLNIAKKKAIIDKFTDIDSKTLC